MKQPFVCPICFGKGLVHAGFYDIGIPPYTLAQHLRPKLAEDVADLALSLPVLIIRH